MWRVPSVATQANKGFQRTALRACECDRDALSLSFRRSDKT